MAFEMTTRSANKIKRRILKEVDELNKRRQELWHECALIDSELKDCEVALRVAKKLEQTTDV